MNRLVLSILIIALIFAVPVHANYLLPNGEPIDGMDWAGLTGDRVFSAADAADINRIFENGHNLVMMDLRAGDTGWVWPTCSWDPADFDYSGYDDLVDHLDMLNSYEASQGSNRRIYMGAQPKLWGTDYVPDCIDENTDWHLNRALDVNFDTPPGNYTDYPNEFSVWDENLEYVYGFWLETVGAHFAGEPSFMVWQTPPNEGFATGNDQNTFNGDLNRAWETCLQANYATLQDLNDEWGTDWQNWEDVNLPVDVSNVYQLQLWWECKSDKIISLYHFAEQTLQDANSDKIILGVKITPQQLFPNWNMATGTRTAYRMGIDLNHYVAGSPADLISDDPYPNTESTNDAQLQAITLDAEYGFLNGLLEKHDKYMCLGEGFTTETSTNESTDANMFSTFWGQTLAYPRIKCAINYTWEVSGFGNLNIKDSENETFLTKLNPYIKRKLKNGVNDYDNKISFWTNTNVNLGAAQQQTALDQPLTGPLWGYIDLKHKFDANNFLFYFNDHLPTLDSNKLLINIAINAKFTEMQDLNDAVYDGLNLTSSFRGLEEADWNRSYYGTAGNMPTIIEALFGWNPSATQAAQSFDANIAASKAILSAAVDTNIFGCDSAVCDFEAGALSGTGAVEALHATSNEPIIIRNSTGSGWTLRNTINPYDNLAGNNSQTSEFNQAWKDWLTFTGMNPLDNALNNFYVWEKSDYAFFSAFGTMNQQYTLNADNNNLLVLKFHGADINYQIIPNTAATYAIDLNLSNKEGAMVFKEKEFDVNIDVSEGDLNSILLINSESVDEGFPVWVVEYGDNNVIIDSNVIGDLNGANVAFSSTKCSEIVQVRLQNGDGDTLTFTDGWSCNGNNGIMQDLNGITRTYENGADNNLILDTPPVITWTDVNSGWQNTDANVLVNLVDESSLKAVTFSYNDSNTVFDCTSIDCTDLNYFITTDGNYSLVVNVSDSIDSNTIESRYVSVDKTAPVNTFVTPTDGSTVNSKTVNFTILEVLEFLTVTVRINGTTSTVFSQSTHCTTDGNTTTCTWTETEIDGTTENTLNITSTDGAGSTDIDSVSFYFSEEGGGGTPGGSPGGSKKSVIVADVNDEPINIDFAEQEQPSGLNIFEAIANFFGGIFGGLAGIPSAIGNPLSANPGGMFAPENIFTVVILFFLGIVAMFMFFGSNKKGMTKKSGKKKMSV